MSAWEKIKNCSASTASIILGTRQSGGSRMENLLLSVQGAKKLPGTHINDFNSLLLMFLHAA